LIHGRLQQADGQTHLQRAHPDGALSQGYRPEPSLLFLGGHEKDSVPAVQPFALFTVKPLA